MSEQWRTSPMVKKPGKMSPRTATEPFLERSALKIRLSARPGTRKCAPRARFALGAVNLSCGGVAPLGPKGWCRHHCHHRLRWWWHSYRLAGELEHHEHHPGRHL